MSHMFTFMLITMVVVVTCSAPITLEELLAARPAKRAPSASELSFNKRNGKCETYEPFQCPSGQCIPIKYLCDGSPDCDDSYDENDNMCTAAARPPVADTERFLQSLLDTHGGDFLAKIFGSKAKASMTAMGGVHSVSVALSQFAHAEDFGAEMGMSDEDVVSMAYVMSDIANGDVEDLDEDEAEDFRFFAVKMMETEFFDNIL